MTEKMKGLKAHQTVLKINFSMSDEPEPVPKSPRSPKSALRLGSSNNDTNVRFQLEIGDNSVQAKPPIERRKSLFSTKDEFFEAKGHKEDPQNSGYLEQLRADNEDQSRARQVLKVYRRHTKPQKSEDEKKNYFTTNRGLLSAHSGIDSQLIISSSISGEDKKKDVQDSETRKQIEINNPNSMLHVAHYTQNKQLMDYVKIEEEGDSNYLKMDVPDCHTFFRLQHELYEINRKKQDFEEMKAKIFDRKNEDDLFEYDKRLKTTIGVQIQSQENIAKIKESKQYLKGKNLAQRIIPSKMKKMDTEVVEGRLNSAVDAMSNKKREKEVFKRINIMQTNHFDDDSD